MLAVGLIEIHVENRIWLGVPADVPQVLVHARVLFLYVKFVYVCGDEVKVPGVVDVFLRPITQEWRPAPLQT